MARGSNREPSERQREWLGHVRACRTRGLSLKAYADQQGLNLQRLCHWRRRLKQRGLVGAAQPVRFSAVPLAGPRDGGAVQRLHFPNGILLEWEGSADLALVEHLLRLACARR